MKLRVLCPISSPALARRIERLVASPHRIVQMEAASAELWAGLTGASVDVIVVSPEDLPFSFAQFLRSLDGLPDRPGVIILTPEADPEVHARFLADGAAGVVYTRLSDPILKGVFHSLLSRVQVEQAARGDDADLDTRADLTDFVTHSLAMRELLSMASRVAAADTSILILGETGVGKEWLARAIHARSRRDTGPFVAVNCAAVPEGLMESELFGHVEGAFTGALRSRRGHFELAHTGTLFLDEIGELPVGLQPKLLRALQEKQIMPLGAEAEIPFDARIIASTNRDLEQAIAQSEFRADLFYRIGVVTLTVPPLRDRREDILTLADHYLKRFSVELSRGTERIGGAARRALRSYDWPGNVRELINVMERAVLLAQDEEIGLLDLPAPLHRQPISSAAGRRTGARFEDEWMNGSLESLRSEVFSPLEKEYLIRLLRECEGRIGETATRADLDPRTLYNKMRRHGLTKEEFKVKNRNR